MSKIMHGIITIALPLNPFVQGRACWIRIRSWGFIIFWKDTLIALQLGHSIPVTNPPELQKQIQTELDQQHVLQNRNSFLPGTTQSAGSNMASIWGIYNRMAKCRFRVLWFQLISPPGLRFYLDYKLFSCACKLPCPACLHVAN